MAAQLKREREQSRKVLADAELAVRSLTLCVLRATHGYSYLQSQNLTKHLNYLRESLHPKGEPSAPPTPPSPKARRPIQNRETSPTSPQFNRISRPPNFPGIHEDEEPSPSSSEGLEKQASPPRKKVKTKPRLSASKLPLPTRGTSPTPLSTGSAGEYLDLSTVTASSKPKKTIRRQSGLLTVNTESLSVPRSGSPAFGSPIRLEAGLAEEEEELAAVQGQLQVEACEEEDHDEIIVKKEKRKGKAREMRESEGEKEDPQEKKRSRNPEELSEPVVKPKLTSRNALQPIDSNGMTPQSRSG